jgi:sentrin-specific protease 1
MLRLKRDHNQPRPRKATADSWLDDDIVNYWFGLIEGRSQRKMVTNSVPVAEKLKVRVVDSQIWAKVSGGQFKFLCKIPDILDQDKVIIPVHHPGHWTILVVNFSKKRFEYYDTLGASTAEAAKAIATVKECFLRYAVSIQKETSLSSFAQYIPTIQQIPQQENGDDCGVFACTLADYLAQDVEFNFTQADIPRFRLKMVRDIRQRRLD